MQSLILPAEVVGLLLCCSWRLVWLALLMVGMVF